MSQADAHVMDGRNGITQIGTMCSFKFLMTHSLPHALAAARDRQPFS
jgi:hypothetical protein